MKIWFKGEEYDLDKKDEDNPINDKKNIGFFTGILDSSFIGFFTGILDSSFIGFFTGILDSSFVSGKKHGDSPGPYIPDVDKYLK